MSGGRKWTGAGFASREQTLDEFVDRLPAGHAARAELAQLRKSLGGHESLARGLEQRLDVARAHLEALRGERDGAVWLWQGDGSDELATLACPVLISADHLRALAVASTGSTARIDPDAVPGGPGSSTTEPYRLVEEVTLVSDQAAGDLLHQVAIGDLDPSLVQVTGENPQDVARVQRVIDGGRFATHYDGMVSVAGHWTHPGGSCTDTARCDCVCLHCLARWEADGRPGPAKDGWTEDRSGVAVSRTNHQVGGCDSCGVNPGQAHAPNCGAGWVLELERCAECGLAADVHGHGETGQDDSHPFVHHAGPPAARGLDRLRAAAEARLAEDAGGTS